MQPSPAPGDPDLSPSPPPPRAFTQGVGLVFQVVGGTLFLTMFFVCCGSSLLSKDTATRTNLTTIGWHRSADVPGRPSYSAQRALTICVFSGVFFGLALAATGLGMQAEHARAAMLGAIVAAVGTAFWCVHFRFAATAGRSTWLALIAAALSLVFALLLVFSIGAIIDLRRNPPPAGHEVLSADYKIPYSHYHDDPPEVRLAAELAQRRERLAVQQKELDMLEQKLQKKLEEGQQEKPS